MDNLSQLEKAIYNLYMSIKRQTLDKVAFKEDELKKINIFQIVDYIKDSIEILVSYRVEKEIKKLKEFEFDRKTENQEYEEIIIKLEKTVRNHIKVK